MSLPPVIVFTGSTHRAETTLTWLGVGAHLAQAGFRVLLVDATLDGSVPALLPQLADAQVDGAPLSELFANPAARPALLNVLKPFRTLFGRDLPRSELVLLPALRAGEGPRPDLLNAARDMARWRETIQLLRGTRYNNQGFDVSLWLLPVGGVPMGRFLSGTLADVLVKVRPPPVKPQSPSEIPDPEQFPDATHIINAYIVRGALVPKRGSAWHLPALGPEADESAALYLARSSVVQAMDAITRGVRDYLSERPHELRLAFATAVAEQDPERAQATFASLWAADFTAALDLFDSEVAPRSGSMLAAMAALRAVREATTKRLWDIRHIAGLALQKLRWSQARVESEEILDAYQQLRAAQDAGANLPNPARLLIDAADALNHAANWRKHSANADVQELAQQALELLKAADELERRPGDCRRWARAAANNARLSLSDELLSRCRVALTIWAEAAPAKHIRDRVAVLFPFALLSGDPGLWLEIRDLCEAMRGIWPADALYCGAIACGHLGDLAGGYSLLGQLHATDQTMFIRAFRDPDMAPLWRGLGQQDFPLLLPGPLLH